MKLANLPNLNIKPKMKILIALDVSGSIMWNINFNKIYRYYLSQITEQIYNFDIEVKVISFDHSILNVKNYNFKNILELVDYNYHIKKTIGRGTDIKEIYKYNLNSNFNADKIIVMSDGYFYPYPSNEDFKNTHFVIISEEYNDPVFKTFEAENLKHTAASIN
jgi:site-specific DNA-adenine methylase